MNKLLQGVLGDCYGGPAIGLQDGKFVLFEWTTGADCEMEVDILASSDTFAGLIAEIILLIKVNKG